MGEILRENDTLERLKEWIDDLENDKSAWVILGKHGQEDYEAMEIQNKYELNILRTILLRYNYIRSCNHSYKRKMRVLTGIFKHTLEYTIEKFICEGDPDLSNCFSKK